MWDPGLRFEELRHGLAFRIGAEAVEAETEILWRRERIGPACQAATFALETALGPVQALAFLADHDAPFIAAGTSLDDQARFCATGAGFLGTSLDYVENLARQFNALGIGNGAFIALRDAARARTG